jgi:ATP-dependent RNA helicase DDX10/DBP4
MVVGLGQKMDMLRGFIKSHLNSKTIVFLSTSKQVRGGWVTCVDVQASRLSSVVWCVV